MEITVAKLVALVVAAGGIVVMAVMRGQRGAVGPGVVLVVALVLIWFSEELGSATGFIGHGEVSSETPGWMVAGVWVVRDGGGAGGFVVELACDRLRRLK